MRTFCPFNVLIQALRRDYIDKGARLGPFQPVYFELDEIKLDIPMEGTVVDGWKITPLIRPVVSFRSYVTCGTCTHKLKACANNFICCFY